MRDAMLRDSTHLFRSMWAAVPFARLRPGMPSCFEVPRDRSSEQMKPETFFSDTLSGAHCDTNWYEGNNGDLGRATPSFAEPAPALLGFDSSIDAYCAENKPPPLQARGQRQYYGHAGECVNANLNILSLYGDRLVSCHPRCGTRSAYSRVVKLDPEPPCCAARL